MSARDRLATAGWGIFCTCSWTWCIGMYLPVILLRELGWPGFLAFAAPNVLGAAAVGYVRGRMRDGPGIAVHQAAAGWFSIIAIAFNAFFCAFVAAAFTPAAPAWAGAAAGGGVLAAGLAASFLPPRAWLPLSLGVFAVSIVTLAALGAGNLAGIPWRAELPPIQVAWLAPVLAFGFLLCPHLDSTFRRALDQSPSRHAFAVFGATFPLMILLTAAYRDDVALAIIPAAHLAAQCAFTIAAHLREVRLRGSPGTRRVLLAVAVALVSVLVLPAAPMEVGEQTYLRFLGFFGLVFPSYVLLFIGPGGALCLCRRNLIIYAAVMVACLPFFELAFFHDCLWLAPVPVAGILLWRAAHALLRRRAAAAG